MCLVQLVSYKGQLLALLFHKCCVRCPTRGICPAFTALTPTAGALVAPVSQYRNAGNGLLIILFGSILQWEHHVRLLIRLPNSTQKGLDPLPHQRSPRGGAPRPS